MQDPDPDAPGPDRRGDDPSPMPPSRARYQTHLTVVNDLKVPIPQEPLKIWADARTTIRVDGKAYPIGPGDTEYAELRTGSDGTVVITSGYSLADGSDKPDMYAPALRVWAGFMDPFERIVVNPDHAFHQRVATAHAQEADDDPDKVNLVTARSYAKKARAPLFTAEDKTNKQPENCAKAIGQMRDGVGFGGGASANATATLFDRLMLHAGGTRQARRAIRAAGPASAGPMPYLAEAVGEAGYFPVDIRARRPVTSSAPRGMVFGKPRGVHASKTTYQEVDHATAQDAFDKLPPHSWKPPAAAAGRDRVGNIFTDFWHWLVHEFDALVDEITDIVVAIADAVVVGIKMIIKGVETVFKAIVTVIDDIASAIGSFFRMLAKIIEDVIAALSVLFHFDRILAVQTFLVEQIRAKLRAVPGQVTANLQPKLDGYFRTGKDAIREAFQKVIDQLDPEHKSKPLHQLPGGSATQRSVFLAQSGAAGPDSGGKSHAAHCAWGLQKMKSGMPAAKLTGGASAGGDDPLTKIWTCFEDKLAKDQDLQSAFGTLKTQFGSLFHASSAVDFFRTALAALLSLLELVAIGSLAVTQAFFDCLFQRLRDLMDTVLGWLDQSIDIPVLSWLYTWLTGQPLTLLNVITLIAAIPVTMLYRVVVGTWPSFDKASADVRPGLKFLFELAAGILSAGIGIVGCVVDGKDNLGTGALDVDQKILAGLLWCRVACTVPAIFQSSPSAIDWFLWSARIVSAIVPTLGLMFLEPDKDTKSFLKYMACALGVIAIICVAMAFIFDGKRDAIAYVGLAGGLVVSLPGLAQPLKTSEEYAIVTAVTDVVAGLVVCACDFALGVLFLTQQS
jgi:hypothetical protein